MIYKFLYLFSVKLLYFVDFIRNRCLITGRSRSYYRMFGLSRHLLRDMSHYGLLPGVTKSSW